MVSKDELERIGFTGLEYFNKDDYSNALTYLNQYLQHDQSNPTIWGLTGLTYHNLKNFQYALYCFDRVLSLDNRNVTAWQMKGTILHGEMDNPVEAIKCLDIVLNIEPSELRYLLRGQCSFKLDKIQEALFFFERGLAMNPDHTSLNNMAGLALFKLERYRDSIPFLERSLRREYSKSIDNILEKAKELQGSADDKSTGQYMQPVMPPSMPMTQAIPVQSTPVSQQAPIYIQVGKIGDQNTSVKDSVVYKSNLTSGQSDKIQICPYCGKDLNFPKTPRFCPFCKEQIMH